LPNVCTTAQIKQNKITLSNGWSLSPVGKQIPLGDLPLDIAVTPDLKYAAVTNNGESTLPLILLRHKLIFLKRMNFIMNGKRKVSYLTSVRKTLSKIKILMKLSGLHVVAFLNLALLLYMLLL
jgi:DNA-binding beta-propeller fold protein YncE